MNEVFHTLRDAVILVAIVILLFLQDWKALLLPVIDVAVSLVGTFAVMSLMGFSLNNLTLFGLVLAIPLPRTASREISHPTEIRAQELPIPGTASPDSIFLTVFPACEIG